MHTQWLKLNGIKMTKSNISLDEYMDLIHLKIKSPRKVNRTEIENKIGIDTLRKKDYQNG